MFKYVGKRNPKDDFDLSILVVKDERMAVPLTQVVRHSPMGMEWGYGGSGPADTALSILVDFLIRENYITGADGHVLSSATGTERAKKMVDPVYMDFKNKHIAGLDREGFEITDKQVENFLKGRGVI